MGRTALYDAFAQSDLDMRGFHILNCPELGQTPEGGGVEPNNYPPILNQWINQYDATTGNFAGTRPNTINLSDWPSPSGKAGKILCVAGGVGTDPDDPLAGSSYVWADYPGGGGPPPAPSGLSAINVKNHGIVGLANAKGDGTTDDTAAIQGCLNAATSGGLSIYFPRGTYRVTAGLTTPAGQITITGDSPWSSVISCDIGVLPAGPILNMSRSAGSIVSRMGFNGNVGQAGSAQVPVRHGIWASGAGQVVVDNCVVYGCLGLGIGFNFCYQVMVQNCWIGACGNIGVALYFCPQSIVRGNIVLSCQEGGVWAVNSQNSTINGNQIYSCAPYGYGVLLLDSDNSAVTGNVVQQCAVGVQLSITASRAQNPTWDAFYSYGYAFTGNTICRNYFGGVQIVNAHGFKVTGNVITDNGQGGCVTGQGYTIEPGLMVPVGAQAGTGYQVGDVVTLDPTSGIGTPAKAVVTRVTTNGGIWPEGLLMISGGNYTTWPTNPVKLTGGSGGPSHGGTQAYCIFSGSRIANAGSGYSVGQALRHNLAPTGTNYFNPVRIMVTSVGAGGAVTGYAVIDGGGYLVNTYGSLAMVGDAYGPSLPTPSINVLPGLMADPSMVAGSGAGAGLDYADAPDVGGGLVLSAGWGLRYSGIFNTGTAGATFNLCTYHQINGGTINGNIITRCASGCGYLNLGANATDRAGYMVFIGNSMRANANTFKGGTGSVGGAIALDNTYNMAPPANSIFDTGTAFSTPLNRIG